MRPMIEAIVRDLSGGITANEIAAAFHNTLAAAIVEVCGRIRQTRRILIACCLSGGTFQNVFCARAV